MYVVMMQLTHENMLLYEAIGGCFCNEDYLSPAWPVVDG